MFTDHGMAPYTALVRWPLITVWLQMHEWVIGGDLKLTGIKEAHMTLTFLILSTTKLAAT